MLNFNEQYYFELFFSFIKERFPIYVQGSVITPSITQSTGQAVQFYTSVILFMPCDSGIIIASSGDWASEHLPDDVQEAT